VTPQEQWSAVDAYVEDLLVGEDAALAAAVQASDEAGLPPIQVSPAQGKLLHLLAKAAGARRILEIGTLGGYSTIWMARALPTDGLLLTLEIDSRHGAVAAANLARAGVADRVQIHVAPALETLRMLAGEGVEPFDLFFVDADKATTAEYFEQCLALSRPGSLIVVDNVVRDGRVLQADGSDADVAGIRRFNDMVASEPRVTATAIQTVGRKGYDGFALVRVES